MGMWWTVREFVAQNLALVLACSVAAMVVCVAAVLVVKTGRSGLYLAFSVITGGGFALFALSFHLEFRLGAYAAAALCVLDGVGYLFAVCGVLIRERTWQRRARRAEQARRLQYCLPDRENSFVQARLNTVLKAADGEDGLPVAEQIDLGHARRLLAEVLEKPLSVGEKLQAEDIGKSFSIYLQKTRWSVADLRAINDAFSALMKLCTKYSVGV